MTAVETALLADKPCGKCGQTKPLDEFHRDVRARDGRYTVCKQCVSARPYKPTHLRVVKTRARHRAMAELVHRHAGEFAILLERCTHEAEAEAARIAAVPAAQRVYGAAEPVRLRRGRPAEGETLMDRIDVGRCSECATHHDRGHACPYCGAQPHEAPPATRTNIHTRALDGERRHVPDETCWCQPTVTEVHAPDGGPHLVLDHHGELSLAVERGIERETNADLRPVRTPVRASRTTGNDWGSS